MTGVASLLVSYLHVRWLDYDTVLVFLNRFRKFCCLPPLPQYDQGKSEYVVIFFWIRQHLLLFQFTEIVIRQSYLDCCRQQRRSFFPAVMPVSRLLGCPCVAFCWLGQHNSGVMLPF